MGIRTALAANSPCWRSASANALMVEALDATEPASINEAIREV